MSLCGKIKTEICNRLPKILSLIPILNKRTIISWKIGCFAETSYWDKWMRTKGGGWPDSFKRRTDPESKLQKPIRELIDLPEGSEIKILDVGAGPVTNLGYCWEGYDLKISAVDPLANEYDKLLKKHKINPPVRTIYCDAENLRSVFDEDSFDFVYAKNCIDHSYGPFESIEQMLSVIKPGCCIYLQHALNEAVNEKYKGLHQWNFFEEDGHFFIGNLHMKTDVTEMFRGKAEVKCQIKNNDTIIVTIHKK